MPSTSNRVGCGELPDYPRDGALMDGSARIDRRRNGSPGDSPTDVLARLPAVVVLERLPVPSLAMARDGTILFANTAFAEMVGYAPDALAGSAFPDPSVPCRPRCARFLVSMCRESGGPSCGIVRVGRCGPG